MKTIPQLLRLSSIITAFGLVACASVTQIGQGSVAFLQKTTANSASKLTQFSAMAMDTIHPPEVKIVEVREKDLKKLPTGKEQALAYANTRNRGFWSFAGPIDFKEPALPKPGTEMDGSLLPPKTP